MVFKSLFLALAASSLCNAAALPQTDVPEEGIVGGVVATQGEVPYIVAISRNGGAHCGGSLINANYVLTAAHCLQGQSVSSITVRAGSLNRASGGTVASAAAFIIHPSFSSSTLSNDIALIRLATSIPTSSTIGYATLAADGSDPAAGLTTTVAGWGSLTEGGAGTTTLRKVDVPIISRAVCRTNYSTSQITDVMFCAGVAAGGKDSCQGDSGGPIYQTSNKVLLGAVSWGDGCARAGKPGVYTRIGSFRSWIASNSS